MRSECLDNVTNLCYSGGQAEGLPGMCSFHGSGRNLGREGQLCKEVHCPQQVTWPNPKSRITETRSAHHELVPRIWKYKTTKEIVEKVQITQYHSHRGKQERELEQKINYRDSKPCSPTLFEQEGNIFESHMSIKKDL